MSDMLATDIIDIDPIPKTRLPDDQIVRGTGQCEARVNDGTRQCGNPSMIGSNVCELHGAKGALVNRGKNAEEGRVDPYIKVKGNSLVARYEKLLTNKEYLSLRNEIAMTEAMIQEALERSDQSDDPLLWQRAEDQLLNFRIGLRTKDKRKQMEAFQRLETIVGQGKTFSGSRKLVRELMQEKAKLSGVEQKRLIAMQNVITTEDAMTMIKRIVDLVREHVHDREDRTRLILALQQFMYGKPLG